MYLIFALLPLSRIVGSDAAVALYDKTLASATTLTSHNWTTSSESPVSEVHCVSMCLEWPECGMALYRRDELPRKCLLTSSKLIIQGLRKPGEQMVCQLY